MSILSIRHGKGLEVYKVLKETFELPDSVTRLRVDVDMDGLFRVSVDFFPAEEGRYRNSDNEHGYRQVQQF